MIEWKENKMYVLIHHKIHFIFYMEL